MMLVSFALETDAVSVAQDANAAVLARHHMFLQQWLALGVMVRPGEDIDGFLHAIQSMPQRFRVRWQKMLKHARITRGPDGWQGLCHVNGASDLQPLKDNADLALLDEVTALVSLGIPEEEPGMMISDAGLEACKFDCFALSETFKKAESLASAGIHQGERIIDVWNQRFRSLARSARHVTIVDRYALSDGVGAAGLERFIKELDGAGRETMLTIYAAIEKPGDEDIASNTLVQFRAKLSRGGIREIQLYLIPDREFRRVHDRYLRFDRSVCELGEGVSVLGSRNNKVFRDCTFNFKPSMPEHHNRETWLKQVCTKDCPYLL